MSPKLFMDKLIQVMCDNQPARGACFAKISSCILMTLCLLSTAAFAQPQDTTAQDRTALKPVVPSNDRSVRVDPSAPTEGSEQASESVGSGATFVALSPALSTVFLGNEPKSLNELRALEAQQAKVAEKIDAVTVNVQQGIAQGSGVIIVGRYVLTAAHVAGSPDRSATIITNDGTRYQARTLGMNQDMDAGLLEITDPDFPSSWPHATLGKSRDLREGQWVVASGHPGGWQEKRGSVIRVGRILKISRGPVRRGDISKKAHTLFTDCALIGGDSGGPLFTLEGKLIGIHSRIGTDVEDNMHVPIDVFGDSWKRLKSGEKWGVLPGFRPMIGVTGTKGDDRPLIADVEALGPAARAGIQPGDLILTFNGAKITTFEELRMGVQARMPGDIIVLTVKRGQNILRLNVTIGVAQEEP